MTLQDSASCPLYNIFPVLKSITLAVVSAEALASKVPLEFHRTQLTVSIVRLDY